mgnify:CR=1 FL=1
MKLIIYTADVVGVESNCLYPHRQVVTDAAGLIAAIAKDHVCAEYKGGYRGTDNFLRSNCVVMDVDNDHSDDPAEWITPESLAEEYGDIRYAITFSRHHMKKDSPDIPPRCQSWKAHLFSNHKWNFFPINQSPSWGKNTSPPRPNKGGSALRSC